jgi:quinol monooxygenase YgiN
MYASVTTTQVQPGRFDEYLKMMAEQITPEVKQLPGLVDFYVLTNREAHQGMTLAIYASEADAIATQTSGKYQALVAKIAHLLVMETVKRAGYAVSKA